MNNINSTEIMTSIVSGNHQAFRVFYDLYYLKVYRFVHHFLPNSHDCEILVSDIFCLVWEKRQLLKNVDNLETYLYQIGRYISLYQICTYSISIDTEHLRT